MRGGLVAGGGFAAAIVFFTVVDVGSSEMRCGCVEPTVGGFSDERSALGMSRMWYWDSLCSWLVEHKRIT